MKRVESAVSGSRPHLALKMQGGEGRAGAPVERPGDSSGGHCTQHWGPLCCPLCHQPAGFYFVHICHKNTPSIVITENKALWAWLALGVLAGRSEVCASLVGVVLEES